MRVRLTRLVNFGDNMKRLADFRDVFIWYPLACPVYSYLWEVFELDGRHEVNGVGYFHRALILQCNGRTSFAVAHPCTTAAVLLVTRSRQITCADCVVYNTEQRMMI